MFAMVIMVLDKWCCVACYENMFKQQWIVFFLCMRHAVIENVFIVSVEAYFLYVPVMRNCSNSSGHVSLFASCAHQGNCPVLRKIQIVSAQANFSKRVTELCSGLFIPCIEDSYTFPTH